MKTMTRLPPFSREQFRDVDRALLSAAGFEAGIIPIEQPEHDMTRVLAQLSPEDAQKMKRKFRKLWRKMVREKKDAPRMQAAIANQAGMGAKKPTKAQKLARKRLVFNKLWEEVVAPALEKFEAVKQEHKKDV